MTFIIHLLILFILLAVQDTKGQQNLHTHDKNKSPTENHSRLENKIRKIARELLLSDVMLFRKKFESDINNLQRNVQILQSKVEKIYDTTKSPFQRIDVSRSIHEATLQRIAKIEHDETILTQRVDNIEKNTRDSTKSYFTNHRNIQSEMAEIKNKMETLNSTFVSNVHVSELSTKIESLESQVHYIEKNITNSEIHMEALMMAHNKYAENMTSEIKKLQNTTTTDQGVLEQQIFEVQDTLTQQIHQVSKINNNVSSIVKQFESTVQSNNLQISILTAFKSELDALSNNMSVFKEITKMSMTDIRELTKSMSVVEDIVHGHNSTINILSGHIDNLTSNVSTLITSNTKQASVIKTLIANISVVENTITTMKNVQNSQIESVRSGQASCTADMYSLMSNVTMIKDSTILLQDAQRQGNSSLKYIKEKHGSVTKQILYNISVMNNILDDLTREQKATLTVVDEKQQLCSASIDSINSSMTNIEKTINRRLEIVTSSNSNGAKELHTLRSTIQQHNVTILDIHSKQVILWKNFSELGREKGDLKSEVKEIQQHLKNTLSVVKNQTSDILTIQQNQYNTQKDMKRLQTTITGTENRLSSSQSRVNSAIYVNNQQSTKIQNIQRKQYSIQGDISSLRGTVSSTGTRINSVQNRLSGAISVNTDQTTKIKSIQQKQTALQKSIPPMEIRLGAIPWFQPWKGRVEVKLMDKWGTVCDDSWDNNDARVVCRMLGRSGGTAYGSAKYGEGDGKIWMDDVACTGSEESLSACSHSGFGIEDCSHSEDAAVSCS